jgi:hypothetical protein
MSITAVNLTGQGWDDDKSGGRSYRRTYDVHSDDPNETMVAVRQALPLAWEADPVDGAAVVVTRTAEQDPKARKLWRGEVIWEWAPEEDEDEDPLERDPKIRWTANRVLVPAIKDRDGDAIVNSAGDFFDPPPERPRTRWIANIQFNATVIPTNLRQYADAVNNAAITIDGEPVAAERAQVVGLDISEIQYWGEDQTAYRSITLAVEVRDDDDESFDLELIDQGYRITGYGGELEDILIPDEQGTLNRPSAPVLLNGSGGKLTNPSPSTAVFLTYDISNLRDLTVFPGIEAA